MGFARAISVNAVSHLLHVEPDRLLDDMGDGAGGGLHCGVELPAGKLTTGRESFGHPYRYTNCVVTLCYIPPYLLLVERNYCPAVDMWGEGCIMVEIQGDTEQHQVTLIFQFVWGYLS